MTKAGSTTKHTTYTVHGAVLFLIGALFGAAILAIALHSYTTYLSPLHTTQGPTTQSSVAPNTGLRNARPTTTTLAAAQDSESTNLPKTSSSRTIPVLAVDRSESNGIAGTLTERLIPGDGAVLIDTSPFIEPDLQYSANVAVDVAKQYVQKKTGATTPAYDFVLTYTMPETQIVGGGSAGAAATLATIALLTNNTIRTDTAITGAINPDGTIGAVGGILEKAHAAADAGYKRFLIPAGQSTVTYYERNVTQTDTAIGHLRRIHYTQHVANVTEAAKAWGLDVQEVATINDAVDNMLIEHT